MELEHDSEKGIPRSSPDLGSAAAPGGFRDALDTAVKGSWTPVTVEHLLERSLVLVRHLELPEALAAALAGRLAPAEPEASEADRDRHARRHALLQNLFLRSPDVLSLVAQHENERELLTDSTINHTQIALLGAITIFTEIADRDPLLAATLVRKYGGKRVANTDVRAKLEAVYVDMTSGEHSLLRHLVQREVSDRATMGETALLGGMLAPYFGLLERRPKRLGEWLIERVHSYFGSIPEHLRDLGVVSPLRREGVGFIARLANAPGWVPQSAIPLSAGFSVPDEGLFEPMESRVGVHPRLEAALAGYSSMYDYGSRCRLLTTVLITARQIRVMNLEDIDFLLERLPHSDSARAEGAWESIIPRIHALGDETRGHSSRYTSGAEDLLAPAILVTSVLKLPPGAAGDTKSADELSGRLFSFLGGYRPLMTPAFYADLTLLCDKHLRTPRTDDRALDISLFDSGPVDEISLDDFER